MLGTELRLPEAPWWASWQAVDSMACGVGILALALILGWGGYLWWAWRYLRDEHRRHDPATARRTLRIWRIVLPITPLTILSAVAVAAFIVVQVFFGFDVYRTMIAFGSFAPPGVWVSGWTMLAAIGLWAIALASLALFRMRRRASLGAPGGDT